MTTIRLTLLAYVSLGGTLAATGRSLAAVPFCLFALLICGELLLRAIPGVPAGHRAGVPAETGVPAARLGLAAMAGLVTLPLVALALHATGVPVRVTPLAAGIAATVSLAAAGAVLRELLRHRRADVPTQRGPHLPAAAAAVGTGTAVAVAVPVVLAIAIGGVAARIYTDSPKPEQPGYLSVALNGWAAGISKPVTVPRRGLVVPVRVTSAGLDPVTVSLRVRISGHLVGARPVTLDADTARSFTIRVPALPSDGCLRPVRISVGATSAGFYARGTGKGRAAC
ncbi:hypothetical protein FB565_002280 [Actinoplanes lutulentus]|uniref:Uncharacterized protein n=1 Tax=Actinoplanes lutulentus TaxID=1287878 RepID=A0A327ZCY5_9ACTN|nr:hypothetical protein [Actinoplanes lutulentus]MBB2942567.1 hypothetical protein [Actinoplanes lutulentus]RAK38148.1 hypothetical protein B0I29_10594 [Actinoplanes lutulentus]